MSNNTNTEVWMAGAIAAFTIDLVVYPLDTIKTRLQSRDYLKTYSAGAGARSPFTVRGLYQGVGSAVIATLPAAGVFFSVYEGSKSVLGGVLSPTVPQPLVHAAASGVAELSSCLVLTPAEVIKQNAQMIRREPGAQGGGSTSIRALRMLRDSPEGARRRLWSGYTALAGRNLPFTALQFPMFEAVRTRAWRWVEQRQTEGQTGRGLLQTGLVNGSSAAVAGSISSVVTTPTDVVKTRMMVLGDEGGRRGSREGQLGAALRVAGLVYRENGVPGLFRGWLLRGGWAAMGSGLYLGTYEGAKVWLAKDKESEVAA